MRTLNTAAQIARLRNDEGEAAKIESMLDSLLGIFNKAGM